MKHNSKSTLTTKYSAGEQIVMDRNVSLRYNKKHHIMEEKVMGKRKSVLKTATAAALTGLDFNICITGICQVHCQYRQLQKNQIPPLRKTAGVQMACTDCP